MKRLIISHKGKTPRYKEKILELDELQGGYTFNFFEDYQSFSYSATFSQIQNERWSTAVKTTSTSTVTFTFAPPSDILFRPIIGTTSATFSRLDNFVGSRFGLTGGDGLYSYEVPRLDANDLISVDNYLDDYFWFTPLSSASASYVRIQRYYQYPVGINSATVSYIFEGSTQFTVGLTQAYNFDSGITQSGVNTRAAFKYLYDKNLNNFQILGGNLAQPSSYVNRFLQFNVNSSLQNFTPFCFSSFTPLTTQRQVATYVSPFIVSNFQPNGFTASNTTQKLPNSTYLLNINYY